MKKRFHKLDDQPSFDFLLFGISTDEREYRLAWLLNSELGWELCRLENICFRQDQHQLIQEFSHYVHTDINSQLTYHLVSNKCEHGYLVEELKNIDFFLKINGQTDDPSIQSPVGRLKALPFIRGFFPVEPAGLKSKHKLLF